MNNGKKRERVKIPPFLMMVVAVILLVSVTYSLTWVLKQGDNFSILGASISKKDFPSSNPAYQIRIQTENNKDSQLTAVYPFFSIPKIDEQIESIIQDYSTGSRESQIEQDKVDYQIGLINDNIINLNILTRKGNQSLVFNRQTGDQITLQDIFVDNSEEILNHSRFIGVEITNLLARDTQFFIDNDYQFIFGGEDLLEVDILDIEPILNKTLIQSLIPNLADILGVKQNKLIVDQQAAKKEYISSLLERQKDIDCRVDKCVALTFDGGPTDKTLPILQTLDQEKALGTFYVVGNEIFNRSEVFATTISLGHEIGNQSWSYPNLADLETAEVSDEIDRTQGIIWNIGKTSAPTFRPPFGSINEADKSLFDGDIVSWDIDSLDWKAQNPEEITNKIISEIQPNSIVLLHDTNQPVVDALPELIQELRKQEYKFVTVSKLSEYVLLDKSL